MSFVFTKERKWARATVLRKNEVCKSLVHNVHNLGALLPGPASLLTMRAEHDLGERSGYGLLRLPHLGVDPRRPGRATQGALTNSFGPWLQPLCAFW